VALIGMFLGAVAGLGIVQLLRGGRPLPRPKRQPPKGVVVGLVAGVGLLHMPRTLIMQMFTFDQGNDSGRSPQLACQALELFGNVGLLRRGPLPAPQFGVHDLAHPPAHGHTIRICQSLDGLDRAWRESDRNRSTKGLWARGADCRTWRHALVGRVSVEVGGLSIAHR